MTKSRSAKARKSRRPARDSAEWAKLVDEWSRSGQSGEAFAAARDLPRSSFQWWRLKLGSPAAVRTVGAKQPSRRTKWSTQPANESVRLVPVHVSDAQFASALDAPPARGDAIGWELRTVDGNVLRAYGAVAFERLDAALVAITKVRSGSRPGRAR